MKTTLVLASVCLFTLAAYQADATVVYTQIPGVYSTGVDDSGNLLPAGTADPHYSLTSTPSGAASALVTPAYYLWAPATSTSQWINDTGSVVDAPAGFYVYTMTFSLSGLDPSSASISGAWVSDNTSEIYLNGLFTGYTHTTPYEFLDFNSFTIDSGFVAGQNTLSFVVNNAVWNPLNPTGLQVQILSATAVPEPTSLTLLGLLGAVSVIWRKLGRG